MGSIPGENQSDLLVTVTNVMEDDSWSSHRIRSMGEMYASSLPRKSERTPLSAEVMLRRAGRHNFNVKVLDASPFGCKVEFLDCPDLDERVFVKFDGLEGLEAYVCWVGDRVVGVEFEKPIHPAVFEALIKRACPTTAIPYAPLGNRRRRHAS
jgi:hypothetical protein